MKIKLLFALLATALITTASAQRRTNDETALEMGVVAWLGALQTDAKPFDPALLKPLYRPDVLTRDAQREMRSWSEYAAALREHFAPYTKIAAGVADDLRITFDGARAVTTFTLRPRLVLRDGSEENPTAQFRLVWEKAGGWWSIAEQTIACSTRSTPNVAVAR